jgi:hypothetical protein
VDAHESEEDTDGEDGFCDDDVSIAEYGCKPDLNPQGDGPHYYGLELEVERIHGKTDRSLDGLADIVRNKMSQCGCKGAICKHDGSLCDGFEIVTPPGSIAKQREWWKWLIEERPEGLGSWSFASTGLHIHCSRAPLSDAEIARMVVMANNKQARPLIEKIAGRRLAYRPHYDAGQSSSEESSFAMLDAKAVANAARGNDKYEALNTSPRNTIEWRMFKGTMRYQSVIRAVEFCDSMIAFQQHVTAHPELFRAEFTHEGRNYMEQYVSWVTDSDRDSKWPVLVGWLWAKHLKQPHQLSDEYGFRIVEEEG